MWPGENFEYSVSYICVLLEVLRTLLSGMHSVRLAVGQVWTYISNYDYVGTLVDFVSSLYFIVPISKDPEEWDMTCQCAVIYLAVYNGPI